MSLIVRLLSKVKVNHKTGCWEWTGAIEKPRPRTLQYGWIGVGTTSVRAHRVAYQLAYGEIPAKMCVCHRCDNAICVNPEHLFLGTYKDNTQDMVRKKRRHSLVGEANTNAKLTESTVREIRRLRRSGGLETTVIAKQFNLTPSHVRGILRGRTWSHVLDSQAAQ